MTEPALTLAELERLLDVHGTRRARWPASAWDAAARLVTAAPAARALWDEAVALDRMLDALPAETPPPALVERVLAAAPASRLPRRWRRAATALVPLAAAASVAFWLASATTPGRVPTPVPTAVELTSLRLGEYASPTDYLLDASDIDVAAAVPSFGCDDSTLGCPTFDADAATPTKGRT